MNQKFIQIFVLSCILSIQLLLNMGLSQNNISVSINVSASIKKGISVINENNSIDFGEIVLSGSSMEVYKAPQEGYKFKIISHPSKPVMINYSSIQLYPIEKPEGVFENSLVFIPKVFHTYSSPNFSNPVEVQSGTYYNPANLSGVGMLNVWVGGKLQINQNNLKGDYKGTLSLTITY